MLLSPRILREYIRLARRAGARGIYTFPLPETHETLNISGVQCSPGVDPPPDRYHLRSVEVVLEIAWLRRRRRFPDRDGSNTGGQCRSLLNRSLRLNDDAQSCEEGACVHQRAWPIDRVFLRARPGAVQSVQSVRSRAQFIPTYILRTYTLSSLERCRAPEHRRSNAGMSSVTFVYECQ